MKINNFKFFLFIALAIGGGLTLAHLSSSKKKPPQISLKRSLVLYTPSPTEKYILGKAVDTQVNPELFPVAIYEARDNKQYFGASGVCYFNAETQTWRLLTMAHVFFKRDKPVSFFLRKLTPVEAKPSWCVTRIITIGSQWGKNIDLAECEIKPLTMPMPLITCDIDYKPSQAIDTELFTFEQAKQAGLKDAGRRMITSLLSGERITLCGIVPEADKQSWYYLTDSPIRQGESGTCFVDEQGSVYFAEGGAAMTATPDIMKQFGLSVTNPGLVFGPFPLKTKL